MNITELEAALKARIDELTETADWRVKEIEAGRLFCGNGVDLLTGQYRNKVAGLKEALTLISQLKQSVEAKRDEMNIVEDDWLHMGLVKFGNKYKTTDVFDVVLKLIDEIIGLSEEKENKT
jgi:hypothetical protein